MLTDEQIMNGQTETIALDPDGKPLLFPARIEAGRTHTNGHDPVTFEDAVAEALSFVFAISMEDGRKATETDPAHGLWSIPVPAELVQSGMRVLHGTHLDEFSGYRVTFE
jgi:hypothetical protein